MRYEIAGQFTGAQRDKKINLVLVFVKHKSLWIVDLCFNNFSRFTMPHIQHCHKLKNRYERTHDISISFHLFYLVDLEIPSVPLGLSQSIHAFCVILSRLVSMRSVIAEKLSLLINLQ